MQVQNRHKIIAPTQIWNIAQLKFESLHQLKIAIPLVVHIAM